MNKVLQKAYFRQRVVKEVLRGRSQAETARRHKISRMSVYRWMQQYDGSLESLKERSRRPQSHPNAHRKDEYTLIKRVWNANRGLGLVCLHLVLEDRHGYRRSVSGLYRAAKRLGICRKRRRKKRHKAQPYDTPKVAGERIQIDVKYVPKECHAPGLSQMYQFTAVDECTRLRFRYIFAEKSSLNAAKFLMMAQNYYPFEVKCVQTDNGREFTNLTYGDSRLSVFESYCKKAGVAHKRIRVATPRHNGKVERVHRIDQERFYDVRSFYSVEDANMQLKRYQRIDNRFPLIVLGRKSPLQYYKDISANV